MKVGVVGVGEMGAAIAGHLKRKGHEVCAFDVNPARLQAAAGQGIATVTGLEDLAPFGELFMAIVATDEQSHVVTDTLSRRANTNALIAVLATNSPNTMVELDRLCRERGKRFIDAPVVYGASGAREGTLLSLCGGSAVDVEFATPALMAYSRKVLRVGPVGAGQLAKACNNLLHWVHCVSNYETLLLAKRFGVDAQHMREVLLECPAFNLTLKRWDTTKFTWQEKDMDVTMDLAQQAGLVLPLAGVTDQLVKLLSAKDVKALLYGEECSYLGRDIKPMNVEEGGLG
ncbi:MAG TPA: NAD(P)-dependent oxidoreductase [Micropepsaceae bacterium]|nr:NAD(P)-dependent oxidoreductase [Micropepsaceae bacterium]